MRTKVVLSGVFAAALMAVFAFAQEGTQCKDCSVSVNSQTGNLVLLYDVSGLGGTTEAAFTLTATLEGHARCKNQGGNCPEAANKFGPNSVGTQGTLGVRNGRARGSVVLQLTTGLQCPGNQRPVIIDATWTDVVFVVEGKTLFSDAGPFSYSAGTCPTQ